MAGVSRLAQRIEGYDWEKKESGFTVIKAEYLGDGRYSLTVEQTDKGMVNPLASLVSRLSAYRTDKVMYEIAGAEIVGQERLSVPLSCDGKYWIVSVISRDNPEYEEADDGQEQ